MMLGSELSVNSLSVITYAFFKDKVILIYVQGECKSCMCS